MRTDHTNRRSIAQRARRDAEREAREPSPALPPHGVVVGQIIYTLHGRRVVADLLSTGRHCRSYGVRIAGEVVGVMGADRAWAQHVRPAMPVMMSLRRTA